MVSHLYPYSAQFVVFLEPLRFFSYPILFKFFSILLKIYIPEMGKGKAT